MQRQLPALLLVAIATAALVVGCGGSDDGSTGATTSNGSSASSEPVATSSLNKAQWVKRANALCTRYREDRLKAVSIYLQQSGGGKSQEERIEGMLKEVYIPSLEEQYAELRTLGAPRGDEDQIEAILAAYERWLGARIEQESPTPSPALNKLLGQAGTLARKYNLIECTYG